MQVNSINNRVNTNFKAKLEVKSGLNYLTENSLKHLTKKAKEIGTDKDKITFFITNHQTILDSKTKAIKGYENYIRAQFSFLSTPQNAYCTMYSGTKGNSKEECNQNLFIALEKLTSSIKDSYHYHKNKKS